MQEATESLNILLAILSETSAILDPLPASSRSPALVAVREMCERIARQTSGIVDTANKKMLEDKHKKIATLKAALKKKDFVSLLEKTQRAQITLQTAAMFMTVSLGSRPNTAIAQIESTVLTTQSVLEDGVDIIVRQPNDPVQGRIVDDDAEPVPTTVVRRGKSHPWQGRGPHTVSNFPGVYTHSFTKLAGRRWAVAGDTYWKPREWCHTTMPFSMPVSKVMSTPRKSYFAMVRRPCWTLMRQVER